MKMKYVVLVLVLLMIATPLAGLMHSSDFAGGSRISHGNINVSLNITSPSPNSGYDGGESITIVVDYNAGKYFADGWEDDIADLVEIYFGGNVIYSANPNTNHGEITKTYTLPTTEGKYEIKAHMHNQHEDKDYYASEYVYVDRTAPDSCTITQPSSSGWYRGTITLEASAHDNVAIKNVDFYLDGTKVGSDTSSPYQYNWDSTSAGDGQHSVYAIAYDYNSHSKQSATLYFHVDNTKPTISWSSPADGSYVHGTIDLKTNPSDATSGVAKVEYRLDSTTGSIIGTATSSPWDVSFDTTITSDGDHTIYAIAYDKAGNAASTSITLHIDNSAPSVNITSPHDGDKVHGTITFSADASDSNSGIAYVLFYIGSTELANDSSSPYQTSINTNNNYNDGTYTLKAVAYNNAGVSSTALISITIDNTNPSITIDTPQANHYYGGTTWINATASDANGISSMAILIDGTQVATSSSSPISYEWDTTQYSDGAYNIEVRATDGAGNTASTNIYANVDNTPPDAFNLSQPANNSITNQRDISFSWEIPTDGGSGLDHYDLIIWNTSSGQHYDQTGLTSNNKDVQFSIDGTYAWYVVAYDHVGNARRSTNIYYFTIDTSGVSVSLSVSNYYFSPNGDGHYDNTTLTASTKDGSSVNWFVRVFNSNGVLEKEYNPPDGSSFSWTWDGTNTQGSVLGTGTYTFKVFAEDQAGNNNSFTIDTTLDLTPPSAFPLSNVEGQQDNAYINVSSPRFQWGSSGDSESGFMYYKLYISTSPPSDYLTANYVYTISGASNTAYTIPDSLPDGTYYWWVVAWDNVYNYKVDTDNYWRFTIDTSVPQFTLSSVEPYWYSPNGDGFHDTLYINATASESVSWSVQIYYQGTDVYDFPSATGTIYKQQYGGQLTQGDGQYYVKITITDDAGNTNSTIIYFVQDTTPMAKPNLIAPTDGSYLNNSYVQFSWDNAPADTTTNAWWKDWFELYDNSGQLISSYNFTARGNSNMGYALTLQDGVYRYHVVRYDKAGNVADSGYNTFVVDTTPPTRPVLQSPPNNNLTNDWVVNFTWEASQDATPLTYTIRLYYAYTGQLYQSHTTTNPWYEWDFSNLNGHMTFKWNVSVVDSAGNENISAETWNISIDHDIPTFTYTITSHYLSPNGDGRLEYVLVNTTSTSNSGETLKWRFVIETNEDPPTILKEYETSNAYYSTYSWVWDGTDDHGNVVPDGNYTLEIDAYDKAGNEQSEFTWVVVDTTPPAVPTIEAPADNVYVNHSYMNITWSAFNDTNITNAVLSIYNSTGLYANISLSMSDTYYNTTFPDGHYYAQIMVEDIAENENFSNVVHFTIDTTPPSSFTPLAPANDAYLNYSSVVFRWSNTTDENFDYYMLRLVFDNGTTYDFGTDYNYSVVNLPAGEYNITWYVVAYDKAGNTRSTATSTLHIDTIAPRNMTDLAPAGLINDTNSVVFSWNSVVDTFFDHYALIIMENGTLYEEHNFTTNGTTLNLPDGIYEWYVIAYDKAGNENISAKEILTIDTTAPFGNLTLNPVYSTLNITIYLNAHDNTTGVGFFRYKVDNGSWSNWIAYVSEYVVNVGLAGEHNISVQYLDNAGHVSPVYTEQTMVSTAPPSVDFNVENATATNGYENTTGWNNITLDINGTSETGMSQMRIEIYNSTGALIYDSGWIDYNATYIIHLSESGYYNITIYVKDKAGLTANATHRIYEDLSAPAISNVDFNHYIAFVNETNITINATDFSGIARWGYEFNGTIYWFSTSQFNLSLPDVEGNYTITLYVEDIFGHVAQKQIWIYEVQHRPTGSITPPVGLSNNDTIVINFYGEDSVFEIVGMYVKIDNGDWKYYNYTPQMDITFIEDGNHTIYVKYVNNIGIESDVYSTWVVIDTAPPDTEIISHIPPYTNAYSISITIRGTDALSGFAYYKVFYRFNGGAWQFFGTFLNNQTTFTLPLTNQGTYEIAIVGYDKAGNHEDITTKATIVVDRTPPSLVVNGENETLTNTFYYNLSWNATDNSGIAYYLILIYKGNLTRAEPWKVINTTSTSISVRLDDNATYTIAIRAYDDAGNYVQKTLKVSENYNYPPSIKNVDIPQNATAGAETTFYADAYDVKGDTLNYTWIINNKTAGYGQYLKYVFSKAGNYTLVLIVSDGVHNITRTWNITVAPSSIHSRGGSAGSPDIFMDLILPILLFIGLLVLVLLLLVFMMKKRKKGGEEREEELSEEELAILNEIKGFLEQHNGEKIDLVVKAVANKMELDSNDVLLVLDYGVSKGIFTKETDADGNVRVFLTSKNIKLVESAQNEKEVNKE